MRISTLAPWIAAAALVAATSGATEEQAPPAADAAKAPAQTAPQSGSVDRSALTSAIFDREPLDALEEVPRDIGKVFYFTEVSGMPGETVRHRWEYGGEVIAEVPFEIGSTRWRTYSSKDVDPSRPGQWSVSTVDASGRVLDTRQFTVLETATEATVPAAPAP